MKKVFLALLLTTSFAFANKVEKGTETVYNDSKEAVSTIYKDAKSLAPKIEDSIKSIAKGLKVGAESVWDILVRQQLVWSICFLILTLSALINWYMFYRRMYPSTSNIEYVVLERDIIGDVPNPKYDQYYANQSDYSDDIRSQVTIKGPIGREQYNAPKLVDNFNTSTKKLYHGLHFTICIGLSVLSIIHFPDMLTGFINPEFGAMKNIAELALQLK